MCGSRKRVAGSRSTPNKSTATDAIDLSLQPDENVSEISVATPVIPKIPMYNKKGMKCLGKLVADGHSIVSGARLQVGDAVKLDVSMSPSGVSLLIRSMSGSRVSGPRIGV